MGITILILLFIISIYVWAIIVLKFKTIRNAQNTSRTFLRSYRNDPNNPLHLFNEKETLVTSSPLEIIYHEGCKDLFYHMNNTNGRLSIVQLDGIENSLKRTIADQIMQLEKSLIILATASSACPFIGLFGTVWGIMGAFRMIGIEGSGNIEVIAPGIAEALITTAAGLAVAIPAMIAYNYLVDRVRALTTEMDNFASEYISTIEKLYMQN